MVNDNRDDKALSYRAKLMLLRAVSRLKLNIDKYSVEELVNIIKKDEDLKSKAVNELRRHLKVCLDACEAYRKKFLVTLNDFFLSKAEAWLYEAEATSEALEFLRKL
jgi:hypothetical protein